MAKKSITMSEKEFLGKRGFSGLSGIGLDTMRIPHGETSRQQKKRIKDQQKQINTYYSGKDQARKEYKNLVKSGKIKVPSKYADTIRTAHGNPDNESVQAARRVLAKRGIDWKTGKFLNSRTTTALNVRNRTKSQSATRSSTKSS